MKPVSVLRVPVGLMYFPEMYEFQSKATTFDDEMVKMQAYLLFLHQL